MKKIAVIGLGYVGLSTAVHAAEAGYSVYGIDTSIEKLEKLKSGDSYIEDISSSRIQTLLSKKNFSVHPNVLELTNIEIILICVPTPLSKDHLPDLTFLSNSIISVAPIMNPNVLLIIESTIEPGTSRGLVVELIEQNSSLKREQMLIAFSPERIDPGNDAWTLKNTPKLVSGINKESAKIASEFFSTFLDKIVEVDSLEIAETAKLLENTFRLINISFINEIAIFCDLLKIDVNKVIDAAATKPYGFMPFYPSIGVGGHCIPVDPIYLANKANKIGAPAEFIDLAVKVNMARPKYIAAMAEAQIGNLSGKRVLVIGVAFKPNISDTRESAVENLISELRQKSATVFWHDDLVKDWNGEKSVRLSSDYDVAILATVHKGIDLSKIGDIPQIDSRGFLY
jgi:UDP-N-acetyl-D-glucosamine dehydrogenase